MEIHWDINLELIPQAQAEQDMAQAPGHRAMGPAIPKRQTWRDMALNAMANSLNSLWMGAITPVT